MITLMFDWQDRPQVTETAAHASMTVPSDVVDRLLLALDAPAPLASALDKALAEPRVRNH